MKLTLTLNSKGTPVIQIDHKDRSTLLEEKTLEQFLRYAKNGLELMEVGGYCYVGTDDSQTTYYIVPKKP